jgi:peptidoglycan hydrolase-like protein with peptidoglycan-binding domain
MKRRRHRRIPYKRLIMLIWKKINKRTKIIAGASLLAVVIAVVLLVTLTGKPVEAAAAAPSGTPASITPVETTPPRTVTLVTPVYAPVSIAKGVTAEVVKDVQERLMELGYMDEDEPDGIFGSLTKQGVEHFQKQHGLKVDSTVNEETYSLLFSSKAKYYTVTVGARDTDVKELQGRLRELGYVTSKATGYFGTETETAVKKFQQRNDLTQDGKVGKKTRELLYSEDAVANAYSVGEKSDEILAFQKRLKTLGFLTTEPDGTFGADTKTAVKRFQENSGLIADGCIGPQTKEALMSKKAESNSLALGSKGSDVTNVQKRLVALKYLKKATGTYDSKTEDAVRSFQYTNKLKVDGKVGAKTMNLLMSSKAKKSTGVKKTGKNVSSFIAVAMSKRGCRYVRGAKGPSRFDCSGFVYWCLNQVGVKQGYMTSATWQHCKRYTRIEGMSNLRRGDVISWKGHVAICAGNGYMIDASSGNGKVVYRKYTGSSYWRSHFVCGFRIF